MVIVIGLKEDLILHIDTNLNIGEMGTSSIEPAESDTDLIAGVLSSDVSITSVQAGKQLTITYNLNSVTGNGNTYSEYGNFMTGDILVNRTIFTNLPKTSAVEFQISTIIHVV